MSYVFIRFIDNIETKNPNVALKKFITDFKPITESHKQFINELSSITTLPTTQHMIAHFDRLTEDYFGFSIEHYINSGCQETVDAKVNVKNISSGKCKYLNKKGEECSIKPHDQNSFCAKHRTSKQAQG
jgi:hypothetical protein